MGFPLVPLERPSGILLYLRVLGKDKTSKRLYLLLEPWKRGNPSTSHLSSSVSVDGKHGDKNICFPTTYWNTVLGPLLIQSLQLPEEVVLGSQFPPWGRVEREFLAAFTVQHVHSSPRRSKQWSVFPDLIYLFWKRLWHQDLWVRKIHFLFELHFEILSILWRYK